MIPFLSPLKESIWLRVTLLALFCGIASTSIWILVSTYLPVSLIFAALTSGVITLAIAVLIGKLVAEYAIKTTDFLARAIMLVTKQKNQVNAPDPNILDSSKDFLCDLVDGLYDFSHKFDSQDEGSVSDLIYFKSLAGSLPLPVVVLNKDQIITFINEVALKYIESIDSSEIINKPFWDVFNLSFVSDYTLETWIKECKNSAVTKNGIWERARINFSDNSRKQFDLAAHYSNKDTHGLETILIFFDKTMQYERDDHDLTFISLAVHELRTPLTIMRGYIEVFNDEIKDSLNDEQKTFMHNMNASAQQLTDFVANILNVVKVEENALTLHLKEEDWSNTLKRACNDMGLRARVHNKIIDIDIEDNLPTVAVDKVSIYEVIANLVENAIKYTHTDQHITIKSYLKDDFVETIVSDKGVGVPDVLIDHIFDKFYRAHKSKNSVVGTGLGLYLCRAIINAHGGQIWVKSKEDEGSTFGFTLPLYKNVADQIKSEDNNSIVRGAHGWIKNHSLYRG
jgi:signal transduction histidine kinase